MLLGRLTSIQPFYCLHTGAGDITKKYVNLFLSRLHYVFIFSTEKSQPPEVKELTVGTNSLTLTWDGASLKTSTYLLRYRIIGPGSVWKEVQLQSTYHQYELTGLNPGTNYEVSV